MSAPKRKQTIKPKLIGKIQDQLPKKSDVRIMGRTSLFDCRPTDMARLHAGIQLAKDPLGQEQLGYSTRTLVQANLPHSRPKNPEIWERRNGDFALTIQSDAYIDPKTGRRELVGIPYGTVPRLVLFYLCSEAVRTKSREISLGDNLSDFLHELGMKNTGGKKGDITRFKQQMKKLVTAKIKFQYDTDNAEGAINASIAKRHFFFWDKNPNQTSLFQSQILLDADFYEEIVANPVPIHLGAVQALKSSSFGLDLYTWLTYRVSRLNKPAVIKWSDLQYQIGSDYASTKDFAKRAREVLTQVKTVWQGLECETVRGGIRLKPCEPSVPRKRLTG